MIDPNPLPQRIRDHAACKGRTDWFHLDHRHHHTRERQIAERLHTCFTCPVLADCREWSPTQYWDGAVTAGQYIPPRSGRHTKADAIALIEGAA